MGSLQEGVMTMLSDIERGILSRARKGAVYSNKEIEQYHSTIRELKDLDLLKCGVSSEKKYALLETFHTTKAGKIALRKDLIHSILTLNFKHLSNSHKIVKRNKRELEGSIFC